ncbi:regulator of Vps4 activity in the MVB pathway-domain-containing protein [Rhodocollybia butyracea]|uniref:Regulator of Vps4 activity in the MVB pathway-domain-containing protein n=1 Tax=Rhodocollybia butyracea TaxID=206335 RepID=A0A9P5UEA1_9AGAR|nr:regulator of Vps4 activity in the MVB pathway-domain-containing protein [Rhodocollybia butyracea]
MLWTSARAKVQLRLSVQRLRTLQEKKGAQAKASRRDIATLVERGKIETARIKVEGIIGEDIHLELLELLELYCELLLARFGVLDQNTREPDPAVSEAVCAIIYAAPRTELKELNVLRDMLTHKYPRDFSVAVIENREACVSDRVVRKLVVATPSGELVDAYLAEIAKAYGVPWTPPSSTAGGDGPDGGVKETTLQSELILPDLKAEAASASSAPKLPDIPPTEGENEKGATSKEGNQTKSTVTKSDPPEDEFDLLTKRFAALKKR